MTPTEAWRIISANSVMKEVGMAIDNLVKEFDKIGGGS